jgi:hypothetical protein
MFTEREDDKKKTKKFIAALILGALIQNANAATVWFSGITTGGIHDFEIDGQLYEVGFTWHTFEGQMSLYPDRHIFLGDFDGANDAASRIRSLLDDAGSASVAKGFNKSFWGCLRLSRTLRSGFVGRRDIPRVFWSLAGRLVHSHK